MPDLHLFFLSQALHDHLLKPKKMKIHMLTLWQISVNLTTLITMMEEENCISLVFNRSVDNLMKDSIPGRKYHPQFDFDSREGNVFCQHEIVIF